MSQKLSRRAFLALAGASGAVLALAACAPTPTATPTPALKKEEPTKPAPTAEPAKKEAVELSYFYGTRVVFPDLKLVQDEMSKIMKERINATIQLNPIEWAAFSDKMNVKNAAGEKYDLCFVSSWANNYYTNVKNGILEDLSDALPKWAPKYYGGLNPAAWKVVKVKGQIFAAPCQQIWASVVGPICRKDLADKYGLDLSKVEKLEDMEPWQDAIVKGEGGNVIPYWPNYNLWWTTLWNLDSPGYGVVTYNDPDIKVRHLWDDDQWMNCLKLTKKWFQAGYFPKEQPPSSDTYVWVKAGKSAWLLHTAKPGVGMEEKAATGYEHVAKILEKPHKLGGGPVATMYGVNKKTSSVEACIGYIELINTDKPFYNLLCKGIEGKHWVWVNKDHEVIGFPEGLNAENHPYNPNSDWEFGDQFNAYYVDEAQVGAWEETRKLNNTAAPVVTAGFVLDREPIKNELAALDAAGKEFSDMYFGIMDYEQVLGDYTSKMKAAGADKVKEEVQKQIDAWKAS